MNMKDEQWSNEKDSEKEFLQVLVVIAILAVIMFLVYHFCIAANITSTGLFNPCLFVLENSVNFLIKNLVLATSYSPLASTIASTELNCRVRNENGCDLCDESPELNF